MSQCDRTTWDRDLETRTRSALAPHEVGLESMVPGLTILCHPDVDRIGERAVLQDLASGRQVALSRLEPLFAAPGSSVRRPLADPFLSRRPLILKAAAAGAVHMTKVGTDCTVSVLGKGPLSSDRQVLCSESCLRQGVVVEMADRIVLLLHPMLSSPPSLPRCGMVGDSRPMLEVRRRIGQVAALDTPVLILGETGSGKELAARAIHDTGPRAAGPFLALNMGALSPSLAASELFGSAKGSFTGADRERPGHFLEAAGGTLFLDEIGEAPPEIQVALLRVLETGEVQPVGGGRPRQSDVRVIAATDADLETLIDEGRFRKALRHRLGACEVVLPALRERRDDIGRLLISFLRRELDAADCGHLLAKPDRSTRPWLSPKLMVQLVAADWPGNVRQLRNIARQLVAVCREASEARLPAELARQVRPATEGAPEKAMPAPLSTPGSSSPPGRRTFRRPEAVTEAELVEALEAHRFRLQPTAAQLRVSRASLYRLIDRFPSVRRPADLQREQIATCFDRCNGDLEAMVDELRVSRKGLRQRMTELKLG